MQLERSNELRALVTRQSGVISRQQALELGVRATLIDDRLRYGRWQRMQQGVYATFTGTPARHAILWAAVLRAGPQAALSHLTAAESHGLISEPSRVVHITVPTMRRVAPISGAIIHHSRAFYGIVHPTAAPPRTRAEHTVIDLTQSCTAFDDALSWLCRGVGRGLTTPELLRDAIAARGRVRWRAELLIALDDVKAGVRSPLEHRYVNRVERAHGLPEARRQVRIVVGGKSHYIDNLYEEAMLAVELDGRAAHPPERRWAVNSC